MITGYVKRLRCCVVISILIGASLAVAGEMAATGPTPYPTKPQDWPGKGPIRCFGWMSQNRAAFWASREKDQGAVVFAGDSLTGGWKDLAKAFPALKVANRGVGGDTSRGLLFRFQEDVLALHPRAVVILIGLNDLTAYGKPADAAANIADMLAMAEKQDPAMPVVLCTLPPSANPKAPVKQPDRLALNEKIKALAAGHKQVGLCDLYPAMATDEGLPKPEYFGEDKLHFVAAGHTEKARLLLPVFGTLNIK